jgi:predicted AAA+ superfamily ATPase
MTGSSARKLRRGGANLLAGRAFRADLFPLTAAEIDHFDLLTYLNTTGLPEFYAGEDSAEFLRAYVGTYLREEIFAEGLTRNLGAFSRFLDVIALVNGQEIQRSEIASDCGVPVRTLEGYFSILQDTLLAFSVPAFAKTVKRKAIRRPKIWLFDVGVVSALTHRGTIQAGTAQFGQALEHFIALELRAYLSYARSQLALQYWRSTSKFEVDFVVGQELAVEVKGTDQVRDKHLNGLRALAEEGLIRQYAVVSCDPQIRKTQDGIMIYPAQEFLQRLWNGKLLADNTSNL